MQRFLTTHSMHDLLDLIDWIGFLPFFPNAIPGFSVEESVDPDRMWSDDGPWEWKGPMIRTGRCLYGKLFSGKAAFVSRDWFPDLANWRRDGYDFEGRCEDELVSHREKLLMAYVTDHGPVLSRIAKRECGFSKGYEGVLSRLEMQTFITGHDFVYAIDRHGKPYGWGNAQLTIPEALLGADTLDQVEGRSPEQSLQRLAEHLHSCMPDIPKAQLLTAIR